MPRLINTDNLAEYKFASDRIIPTEWQQGWNDAIDTIMNETPTVDAEPVVRCKDCRFFYKYGFKLEYTECTHFDCDVTEYGYCWWGERREDEKNTNTI